MRILCLLLASIPLAASEIPGAPHRDLLQGREVVPSVDEGRRSEAPRGQRPRSIEERFFGKHGPFLWRARPPLQGVRFSTLYQPNTKVKGEDGEFDLGHIRLEGRVPVAVAEDTFLLVGVETGARLFDIDSEFEGLESSETLYDLGLRLGLGHFFADDLLVVGVFRPGIHSDLDGSLNGDDYRFFGSVMGTYRLLEDLYLRAGVAATPDFPHAPIIPIGGVAWIIGPRWRLDALLPRSLRLSWSPIPEATFHIGATLEGQQYHARTDRETGKAEFDVWVREVRLGVGGLYRLGGGLSVFARVGATVGGRYEFDPPSGKVEGRHERAPFLQAGLGWEF